MQAEDFARIDLAVGEEYRAYELVGIFGRLLFDRGAGFFYGAGAVVAKTRIVSFVHAHVNSLRVNYCVHDQIGRLDGGIRGYSVT